MQLDFEHIWNPQVAILDYGRLFEHWETRGYKAPMKTVPVMTVPAELLGC